MADALMGVTETSATAATIVDSMAQLYLQQESKMMPLVLDFSSLAVKGASAIKVPKSGGFSVASKAENTAADASVITYGGETISLDQHRYIQFLLEDIAGQQASVDVISDAILKASKDLALDIDTKIIAELRTASTSGPDHEIKFNDATNEDLELVDILEARKLLQIQKLPANELYFAIGPDQEKNMLLIDNFIDASKYGSNSPVMNGEIGKVFGMPVIVHTSLSQEALCWHKSAVGFALQFGPRVQKVYDVAQLGWRYSLDYLGGFEVLDVGTGGGKRNVHITETP